MNQMTSTSELDDDLRPEYDLRELLRRGVRGKYADRFREGVYLVPLDPDVARAFPTAEAVNQALRLAIQLSRMAQPEPEPIGA
jgi:hypothetical protein